MAQPVRGRVELADGSVAGSDDDDGPMPPFGLIIAEAQDLGVFRHGHGGGGRTVADGEG